MIDLKAGHVLLPVFIKQNALIFGSDHDCSMVSLYCKFENFGVTFISQIFYIQIISEFLNLRVSVHVFYNVYSDSFVVRTLSSRGNRFRNISEN